MILRSISVEGLGCFADAFTAGPFAPGINVLSGANGLGKSTLMRAVSLAFFEPHRARSAEVQALRPWGRRLTPRVGVEFEHAGRVWRVRKRFLEGASSHVETREGDSWVRFAQGDSADEFLRELLLTETDKPRSANRENWGVAQVLWTTQGDLSLPPLAPSVIESVRSSVGAQLAALSAAIDRRVDEEYLKFFSPASGKLKSGRSAAPQILLEAERDRLAGECRAAEDLLRQFETESNHIEAARAGATAATNSHKALARELERVRTAAGVFGKLSGERKERAAALDSAQTRHKAQRERIESIERLRRQVADSEKLLAAVAAGLPGLGAELKAREKTAGAADVAYAAAAAAETQAQTGLRTAQLSAEYLRARGQRSGIARRLEGIAAARAEVQNADERKAAVQAPTEAQVRELRKVLAEETDAQRRLGMARIAVALVPETDLQIAVIAGEKPGPARCPAGRRIVLAGAPNLTFAIPGVGRFEATGPVSDYESVRRDMGKQLEWLGTFSKEFGSADPDLLEGRRQEMARLEAGIQEARRAVSVLLAGDSEAGLREAHARLSNRIGEIETVHPQWAALPPDAAATIVRADAEATDKAVERRQAGAFARAAHANASEGRAQLTVAAGRQAAFGESLERARQSLAGYLADGVGDEDRRKLQDQAAVEFDACRLALERIEAELKGFGEDPGIEARRLSAQTTAAEEHARTAREELLRAETRIQGLVGRRPYAALTEVSERLGVVGEQLERERNRMSALALLCKAIEEARAEMMTAVASPVERIASDYLEEICGCPLADIRLTPALAPERVIPAAMAEAMAETTEAAVGTDRLSGGEREQVFFCTRLALATELARRERQTVVLDDVLTFTDDERMGRICRLLARLGDRLQTIVVTCHPERFANIPGAGRIDLTAARNRNAPAATES